MNETHEPSNVHPELHEGTDCELVWLVDGHEVPFKGKHVNSHLYDKNLAPDTFENTQTSSTELLWF